MEKHNRRCTDKEYETPLFTHPEAISAYRLARIDELAAKIARAGAERNMPDVVVEGEGPFCGLKDVEELLDLLTDEDWAGVGARGEDVRQFKRMSGVGLNASTPVEVARFLYAIKDRLGEIVSGKETPDACDHAAEVLREQAKAILDGMGGN